MSSVGKNIEKKEGKERIGKTEEKRGKIKVPKQMQDGVE